MTVTKDKYVTIAYQFATPEGYLLGTSDRQGPLTFCAGSGDILPGLDRALAGAEEGESRDFVIAAADAYGLRDETLVAQVARADLGLPGEPKIGWRVEAEIGGRWRAALISEIAGDQVTVDANHPLAGVDLHFQTRVLEVSDEAPVMEGCGCGGGGCGSGGGCGGHAQEGSAEACGCGSSETSGCGSGSCGCGGH